MKGFYQKGITALEILMVIAIISLLFLIALPQFSKIKENQVLKNTVEEAVSALRTAQSQSLASIDSSTYGVHFDQNRIIIFKGGIFSEGAPDNKIIDISSPARISNVAFGGVSSSSGDLYFTRLSGVPSKTGTINVSTSSALKIITISSTGAVSIN